MTPGGISLKRRMLSLWSLRFPLKAKFDTFTVSGQRRGSDLGEEFPEIGATWGSPKPSFVPDRMTWRFH